VTDKRWIRQHSAGGVVIKRDEGCISVLLIKPRNRDRWQLPKGTIDPGESPETTALREVREEGGVEARILTPLRPIRYFYQLGGHKYMKTVDFFLMEYFGGSVRDHDSEVEEARWFPLEQAVTTLSFKTEQELVEEAAAWLQQHPANAAP
jgi:8-oxo-dGTP pyrophosphatase MutT (NUDIX family)